MKKAFAKVTGALSISLLCAGVCVSATPASAVNNPPAERQARTMIIIPTAALAPKAAPFVAPAAMPARMPAVTRPYGHPSMHGYRKSVYTGKYYFADQESFRKCVMDRESNFTYGARNGAGSSAAGAYQFLDNSWREGLAYMIFHELKKDYGVTVAKQIRTKLMKTPINKWSREMQDRGFFTALNYEGKWDGKHHWNATVPGTSC